MKKLMSGLMVLALLSPSAHAGYTQISGGALSTTLVLLLAKGADEAAMVEAQQYALNDSRDIGAALRATIEEIRLSAAEEGVESVIRATDEELIHAIAEMEE